MKKTKFLIGLLIIFSCFIIGNSNVKAEENYKVSFRSNTVDYGDNIYVDMEGFSDEDKTKPIYAYFAPQTDYTENGGMISIKLQDVNSDSPYFETSSYMIMGHSYVMHSIHVGNKLYTTTPGRGEDGIFTTNCNDIKVEFPLSIDRFEVKSNSKEVTKTGKVKFIIEISNADKYDLDNMSIGIRNYKESNVSVYGYLTRMNINEYHFDLLKAQGSKNLTNGEYIISTLNIFPKGGGQAVQFIADNYGGQERNILLTSTFKIVDQQKTTNNQKEETKKTEEFLKKVTIKKTSAKINEKVEVDLDTKKNLSSATLIFSNDKESMTVTVKKLNSKDSYFVIPFTTNSGNYTLDFAVLKDVDGKEYQYRKGENYFNIVHFDFNSTLTIDSTFKDGDSLSLDNSKMTAEVIEKIKKLDSNIVLDINANENPLITKEMFEAIKGSNKTIVIKYNDVEWTFNGLDIKNIKPIDVSTNIYNASKDTDIKSIIKKGLVIDFANNDKLPGKCLIKLYNNEELNTLLKNKNANIYYYNEEKGKFEIIELDSKFNKKGYYEFYISHNSKYLVTNETVEDSYVINTNKSKTSNKFSLDLNTILIIGIPSILVIIILIIILIAKSNKKKKQKVALNNNINNMENTNITNDNNNINNEINNDNNDLSNNIDTSNDNIDQNNINE